MNGSLNLSGFTSNLYIFSMKGRDFLMYSFYLSGSSEIKLHVLTHELKWVWHLWARGKARINGVVVLQSTGRLTKNNKCLLVLCQHWVIQDYGILYLSKRERQGIQKQCYPHSDNAVTVVASLLPPTSWSPTGRRQSNCLSKSPRGWTNGIKHECV